MLKYTYVNLELITDQDKYLMIDKGIRDDISVISTKMQKNEEKKEKKNNKFNNTKSISGSTTSNGHVYGEIDITGFRFLMKKLSASETGRLI